MDMQDYSFMAFVTNNIFFVLTAAGAVIGLLFTLRSQQPHAFKKIREDINPYIIYIFAAVLLWLLIAARINTSINSSRLITLISLNEKPSNIGESSYKNLLESNIETSFYLDMAFFAITLIIFWRVAIIFIDWLLEKES